MNDDSGNRGREGHGGSAGPGGPGGGEGPQARWWARARAILEDVLELPLAERAGAAAHRCDGDETLRAEVVSLLGADARAADATDATGHFLEAGAAAAYAAGLAREAAESEDPGRIGPYEIVEVLGQGGTARVYRARRSDPDRTDAGRSDASGGVRGDVALKVIKPGLDTDEVLGRFRLEREMLAALDHPGLVAALDAGVTGAGRPYLVMEHVDGAPIDRHVRERDLSLRARLRLFLEVADAVEHAHRHLVLHRDLKPSNVLVRADGRAVVLDFGVAKLLREETGSGWTRPGARGPLTLSHASPEQVRGESLTTASDVYSLGVLLYELLAGRGPYSPEAGRGAPEPASRGAADEPGTRAPRVTERDVLEREPLPPSAHGLPELRGDLDTIVLTALRKDPDERYPTARQLADDVRRHLAHEPIEARREPLLRRAAKLARRRPWAVGAAAVIVATLAAGWAATRASLVRVRASEAVAWRAHADAAYVTARLAEVLERVAAGEALGEPGVLALLAETEQRVDAELADAPEAEARMRHALGRVYLRLGRIADAERHLVRALELARTTRGLGRRDVEENERLLAELRGAEREGTEPR